MLSILLLAIAPILQTEGDEATVQQPGDDLQVPTGVLQESGDEYVLDLSELDEGGLTLRQFIKICQLNTGLNFTLDESTQAGLRDKLDRRKLLLYGPKRIKKDEFYAFFQIMMKIHGFVCVPQGSGDLTVIVIVEQLASNQVLIKSNAPFVEEKDVADFANQPGTYLYTVVHVQHADANDLGTNLRSALGGNAGDNSAFMPLTQESALLVQGYGPFVAAAVRMINVLDVERDMPRPVFKKVKLRDADATELAEVVGSLVEALTEVEQQRDNNRRGQTQTVRVETVVEAYEADNSLLITASSEVIDDILDLVSQLDTRVEDPESNFHVYILQHLSVAQLENLGGGGEGGEAAAGGGEEGGLVLPGTQNTEMRFSEFWDEVVDAEEQVADQQGGQGGGSRRSGEQKPVISFNDSTNAVIVSATRTRWAEIKSLLDLLDKPQPQVLVQAALIEVTDDFRREIGFEYAAVDLPTGDESEQFVFTSVGITSAEQIGDPRLPSPTAPGITYGVFDGADLGIPAILQATQNSSEANVLSVPSVLVANNQTASVISAETVQVPTSSVNQGVISNDFEPLDAGIKLSIRPSISAGNFLRLAIALEVSAFRESGNEGAPPNTVTRTITTQVTLPDGATMWLGGIKRDDFLKVEQGIPFLSDIPLIGFLFGKNTKTTDKTTLFFFCTPRIIDDFDELEDLSNEGKAQAAETIGLERVRMIDPEFQLESPEDVIYDRDSDEDGQPDSAEINMSAFSSPAYSSGGGVVDPTRSGEYHQRRNGSQQ